MAENEKTVESVEATMKAEIAQREAVIDQMKDAIDLRDRHIADLQEEVIGLIQVNGTHVESLRGFSALVTTLVRTQKQPGMR